MARDESGIEFVRPSFGTGDIPSNVKFICNKCGAVTHDAWYMVNDGSNRQYIRTLLCDSCKRKREVKHG